MAFDENTKLAEATLGQYTEVLIRGNGFGHESLWIKSHFGASPFGIVEENIDGYTHNICQFVMQNFFQEKNYKKVGETYYDDSGEVAVTFENLETDLGQFIKVYKNAMVMYERELPNSNTGTVIKEKLCVSINKYGPREIVYRLYSPIGKDSVLQEWIKFAHTNNMYKGKKIDADCQYLNVKDVTWDDLILPKKTQALIKMRVNEMFDLKDYLDANEIPLKGGVILAGPPGTGKAQPLDSTVFTADGPVKMGDIKVGNMVSVPSGETAKVSGVYPQGEKETFKITFTNGDTVECSKEHLWSIQERKKTKIVDTEYLLNNYTKQNKRIRLPITKAVEFNEKILSIDPYLMGVLLGDGCFRKGGLSFSSKDESIIEFITTLVDEDSCTVKFTSDCDYNIVQKDGRRNRYCPNPVVGYLKDYGLWGKYSYDKHIPNDYIYNSIENRYKLIQGLMDTDGWVDSRTGKPYFGTTSYQLAMDVKNIIQSLGGNVRITSKEPSFTYKEERKIGRLFYMLCIQITDATKLFTLDRKKILIKERKKYLPTRLIRSIESVGMKESQCIMVDHPDHLYITDNYVVTHNTVICKILAKELAHTIIYALPDHLGRTGDIKRVCEMAKDLAPCVLIIEDIDYIAEERDHSRNAGGVIELMNYLDGVQEFNNVITLATTNAQEKIEEALKNRPGRFDRVVQVPRPNEECRLRMLKNFASKFRLIDNIDWDLLVQKTDKLSGAHVKDLVKTAAMHAIRKMSVDENKKAIVGMEHFKAALDEIMNIDWATASKLQGKGNKIGFAADDF